MGSFVSGEWKVRFLLILCISLDQVVQEAVVFSGWTGPDGINFEYESTPYYFSSLVFFCQHSYTPCRRESSVRCTNRSKMYVNMRLTHHRCSTAHTSKPLAVFIRGLFEAWSRMDQTSSTARLVESYVIVQVSPSYPGSWACADLWSTQYNALLDLASNRSNLYSPLWHGPPATALTPQGQLAALDTLNSAAGLGAPILLSSR